MGAEIKRPRPNPRPSTERDVQKERLSAFTDGVVAVIITIMVLELKPPAGTDLAALARIAPTFLSYGLSFISVAIYWNNHHHFFNLVEDVDGGILWANLHLLFWLSLIPFTTAWMGEHYRAVIPTAFFGLSLLAPALAWSILQSVIIRRQGPASPLKAAVGADLKGKLSALLYMAGIAAAFFNPFVADAFYLGVALMWLIPDRRIERKVGMG
jgi:uncharacterized membrane protein